MATTRKGQKRGTTKQAASERSAGALLQPVVDSVRAHPVATAAAVAAGGIAVARLARGSGRRVAAEKQAKPARKTRSGGGGAPRGGLAAKVQPDAALGAVVGSDAMTRADITKRIWEYIKKNGLQDGANRRMINADDRLRSIFGKDQVSMFEMTRLVNAHVSPV